MWFLDDKPAGIIVEIFDQDKIQVGSKMFVNFGTYNLLIENLAQ